MGWKTFGDTIKELASSSSVLSERNRGACVLWSPQAGKLKGHKEDGGPPSSTNDGSRSYREVVQKVLPRVSAVVLDASIVEIVRTYEGDGSVLLGLNEDQVLRALVDMEEKVRVLLEDILALNAALKEKKLCRWAWAMILGLMKEGKDCSLGSEGDGLKGGEGSLGVG